MTNGTGRDEARLGEEGEARRDEARRDEAERGDDE